MHHTMVCRSRRKGIRNSSQETEISGSGRRGAHDLGYRLGNGCSLDLDRRVEARFFDKIREEEAVVANCSGWHWMHGLAIGGLLLCSVDGVCGFCDAAEGGDLGRFGWLGFDGLLLGRGGCSGLLASRFGGRGGLAPLEHVVQVAATARRIGQLGLGDLGWGLVGQLVVAGGGGEQAGLAAGPFLRGGVDDHRNPVVLLQLCFGLLVGAVLGSEYRLGQHLVRSRIFPVLQLHEVGHFVGGSLDNQIEAVLELLADWRLVVDEHRDSVLAAADDCAETLDKSANPGDLQTGAGDDENAGAGSDV